jgi:hypothetical protein
VKTYSFFNILLVAGVMLFSLYSFAQSEDQDSLPLRKRQYDYSRIFSTNHTNFVLRFDAVPPPVSIHFNHPGLGVHVKATGGVQIGWVYQFNFPKHWGFQTGLRGAIDNDYSSLFISEKYSGLQGDRTVYFGVSNISAMLPLDACYYIPLYDLHQHWFVNLKLGMDITYCTKDDETTTWIDYQTNMNTASLTTSNSNGNWGRIFTSFHGTAGINYILPNKRILNLQMIGNWSPLYKKTYQYSFLPGSSKEIDGTYTRNFSYIGFELNYILTSPYRMGRKHKRQ